MPPGNVIRLQVPEFLLAALLLCLVYIFIHQQDEALNGGQFTIYYFKPRLFFHICLYNYL
ncbi:hypothetical protein A0256_04195 [Mucilaginibacter sp. PAMC 26640]|nr:hypothetical protein A0256_04195 [Mucilaginibacter sp. PAMC 26640]